MVREQPFNLLDLPIDILALILRPLLILPEGQPVLLCPCAHPPPIRASLLTVLLIHPAIHAIACPLFYEGNSFVLDLTGPHTNHVRHVVHHPSKDGGLPSERDAGARLPLLASPGALRRIASLEMRIDKFRGWILTDAVPLLEDMVVRGGLASLCVTVRAAVNRTRNSINGRVGESLTPPSDYVLSARPLLALLADPYLRASRLRVDAAHGSAWCRFHPGRGCGRTAADPSEQAMSTAAGNGMKQGPRLVEIDWSLIVREMDPEGRELVPAWSEGRGGSYHHSMRR
ncbi:hypothetical protein HJFPF1_01272 [Paramyrothecium foliicola]|nr:hypothetical protein HJFPF1_01272 [Paramyrothecium foliicola]